MSQYQIQRLTFSGILDQSFRLIRDHFVAMTLPFVVVYVPYVVGVELLGFNELSANPALLMDNLGRFFGLLAAIIVWMMVTGSFAQLVVTHVVADCYLGNPISVAAATRRALRTFMPYLGTTILVGLALLGLFILIVTIPVAIYFSFAWVLIGPVVVVEKVYGPKALSRSRALVKGHFWETLAMVFVSSMLVGFASGGLSILFKFIPVVGPVLTGIVEGVTAAFLPAVIVVLYVDLRCRKEDFDLQLLSRQIGGGAAAGAPLPAAPQGTDAPVG